MRRLLPFLFAATPWFTVLPQANPGHWTVDHPLDGFTTDELGNLYTLSGNDIDLYSRDGTHLAHNSFNSFGSISRMDAFSSLKPLIFSSAQGQLALLDNTLSIQGAPIYLSRSGFPQVTLACMGVMGRMWFFDDRDLALLRVDDQLQPVANTGRLDQVLSFTPQPTYMEEADGRLYLVDPAHGVLVFDLFGTFVRTLPIIGVQRVQVRDGFLWFVQDGALHRYNLRAFTQEPVPWPGGKPSLQVLDARIEHGRLYRLLPDRLEVEPLGP
ncbi:MAG: hypothetical protein JST38_17380 [Bacteroidetes bacterium]|nr:hypothetical protein [Bacteroidota bacterium]